MGSSAHGAHLVFFNSDSKAVSCGNYYLCASVGKSYSCYLVALVKTYGSQTVLSYVFVCGQGSSLDLAVLCNHDKEFALFIISGLYHCGNFLVLGKREHIYYVYSS